MMTKMRSMAKPIFWVIIVAFILGMGLMGITDILKTKPMVGEIAGQKIKYEDYYRMLQNAYQNYLQQNPDKDIDEQTMKKLNDEVWKQLVQKIIYDKCIKEYNIKVSDKEIAWKILNEPLDVLKNNENLQTDGKFDKDKYLQALQNTDTGLMSYLENYYRSYLPMEKLQNLIKSTAIVTDEEVKQDYIDKNRKGKAEIIVFDPKTIKDVKISDDEIAEYYDKNKEAYKIEPTVKLKYITMPLEPSLEDQLIAKTKIDSIYKQINTENFAELAKRYSQCPSADKGGDLGFFGKGRMDKAFEEQAFSMKKGEISEPIKSRFGWHIIMLTDIRTKDGEKEVRASHILIKEEPSITTKQNLERKAEDFYQRVQHGDFEKIAKDLKYEIKETAEIKKTATYIPEIGRNPELIKFAFDNKIGTVAEPIKDRRGNYIVVIISDKMDEHYEPLSDVTDEIKKKIENRKQKEEMRKKANELAKQITSDKFQTFANDNNLKLITTNLFAVKDYIKDVGREQEINRAILNLKEVGKITPILEGKQAFYIAKLIEYHPEDMKQFEKEKKNLKDKMILRKQKEVYDEWYAKMKEKSKIVDNRSQFFDI